MPTSDANLSPAQYRVWLKSTAQSNVLSRLPPYYEPAGLATADHARRLLAELRNTDPKARPVDEVMADVRAFAAWVEARQKTSRRAILAEREGPGVVEWTEFGEDAEASDPRPVDQTDHDALRAMAAKGHEARVEEPSAPASAPAPPPDPLWDAFLDGLNPQ